jgi:FAD:protein FMN transferase
MNRRRFLAVSAAAVCAPRGAMAETRWQGRAFGAECSVILHGPKGDADRALAALPGLIERIEAEFSLYRPSALTRLNATGRLEAPSLEFRGLVTLADRVHQLTGGAFDPTVQPIWQALAEGRLSRAPIGWGKVGIGEAITLKPGMALTFNGIAQGFGADAVRALLASYGFDKALIDMGEFAALGGPFSIGIADPLHGMLATRTLTGAAIATSSPMATLVNGQPHIMHPDGRPPVWSTVSVMATSAALADALSTALVFLPRDQIATLSDPDLVGVAVVDAEGNFQTI